MWFFKKRSPKENFNQDDNEYTNSIINDDSKYFKYFHSVIGPEIYHRQSRTYFVCCAFCTQLHKSNCHDFCFSCSKRVYPSCGSVLPESFSIGGLYYSKNNSEDRPWIFCTPCTNFESLNESKYFRNFVVPDNQITIANLEALEGLFLGFSRGKRPCHICASININLYNSCPHNVRSELSPCHKFVYEIQQKYKAITGMVKYVDS